jgi:putative SOS response-associated peptidase YedK
MCGRFTLTGRPHRLRERFGLAAAPELTPRYNIAPSQPVLVIPNRTQRVLRPARWGLVPHWASDLSGGHKMINARAETLASRAPFRAALERRRCLIPADGFYEWKHDGKQRRAPFYVRRRDGEPFAFAGLWDVWRPRDGEPVASCTIITTAANEVVGELHDRMPVILAREAYDTWLAPAPLHADLLQPWLVPCPAEWLEAYPVSTRVNSPDQDDAECIARIAENGSQQSALSGQPDRRRTSSDRDDPS